MEEHKIPGSNKVIYIPDFITTTEEEYILSKIYQAPKLKWVQLKRRRLQNWGGIPSIKSGQLLSEKLPNFLIDFIFSKFEKLNLFKDSPHGQPNHCLVNEYKSGQGISPHEDGPLYYPTVATISLKSHCILNIYQYKEQGIISSQPIMKIFQEPRSLLIIKGPFYENHLHGIEEKMVDENLSRENIANWDLLGKKPLKSMKRDTRVSLTYRDVLKMVKIHMN